MSTVRRLYFGPEPIRTLRWEGDDLIDDASGGRRLAVEGTRSGGVVSWGFPFDRSATSPSGDFLVLWTVCGTKAIVSDGRTVVRELNRSFYLAHVYEYPLCVFALPGGREVVAHCPERADRLELDDLRTGERLTTRPDAEEGSGLFHSRLAAAPGGRHFLSAGWMWHPVGMLALYDAERALPDPRTLDGGGLRIVNGETGSACWLDDDRLAVVATDEEPFDHDEVDEDELQPNELGVWSLAQSRWLGRGRPSGRPGILVAFGDRVLGMHGHPKLLDPYTGELIEEWPDLDTGRQTTSIVGGNPLPAVAVDASSRRFAVADGQHVSLVESI